MSIFDFVICAICAAWLLLPVAVALACEVIDGRRAAK